MCIVLIVSQSRSVSSNSVHLVDETGVCMCVCFVCVLWGDDAEHHSVLYDT